MPEPGDRLTAAGGAKPYPGAAVPVAPPVTPADDGAAYRPLAVPAVIGCAVAVLYAAFLLLCWGASFLTNMPPYLPLYTLLLPAAAVALSAVGWVQVQRSEGTRAGGGLALWGMALGGLFGLSYGAYLAGSQAALRTQAETFANQWIELVHQGKLDEAFRLTLEPDKRPPVGPELRRNLELRFNNAAGPDRKGGLTAFRESDAVLLLNHGRTPEAAAQTETRALGARALSYSGGLYQVVLEYEVRSPEYTVHLQIGLQGAESRQEGRQWAIILKETQPRPPYEETAEGTRVRDLHTSSNAFATEWMAKLGAGKLVEAYLDTQEPARRRELQAGYAAHLVAAGLAPGVAALGLDARTQALLPGYRAFAEGGLIRADDKTFWAEGRLRTALPADLKKMFAQAPQEFALALQSSKVSLPIWERVGDKVRFSQDFELTALPVYFAEGRIVTETDAAALDQPDVNPVWRVAAIELTSGRSAGMAPAPGR